MPSCRYCEYTCEDFGKLARHIATSKKGHSRGKKWAASYLLKVRLLNKRKVQEHSPLTDEQREALAENRVVTQRVLSGELKDVRTMCPVCTKGSRQNLPVEFTESRTAWRAANGTLVVCCLKCSRKR